MNDRRTVRRTVRRVTSVLGTVLLLALAAFVVAVALGQLRVTPVLSGSMRPGIDPGDALVTHRIDSNQVRVGDVIVLWVPAEFGGGQIAHRVTSVTQSNGRTVVTTKGDANKVGDSWHAMLPAQVYRSQLVLPYLGWIVDFKAAGGVRYLVVALGIVACGVGIGALRHRRAATTTADDGAATTAVPPVDDQDHRHVEVPNPEGITR